MIDLIIFRVDRLRFRSSKMISSYHDATIMMRTYLKPFHRFLAVLSNEATS